MKKGLYMLMILVSFSSISLANKINTKFENGVFYLNPGKRTIYDTRIYSSVYAKTPLGNKVWSEWKGKYFSFEDRGIIIRKNVMEIMFYNRFSCHPLKPYFIVKVFFDSDISEKGDIMKWKSKEKTYKGEVSYIINDDHLTFISLIASNAIYKHSSNFISPNTTINVLPYCVFHDSSTRPYKEVTFPAEIRIPKHQGLPRKIFIMFDGIGFAFKINRWY